MVTAHTRHMSRGSNKTSEKRRENWVEAPGIERRPLPDSVRNQGRSGAAGETNETKIGRVDLDRAAELAARQTAPGEVGGFADDAEDLATALWEQAARSSAEAVAFSLDGAL